MSKQWDFKGWATRHNVLCGDGRTIKPGAFEHNDNQTVPLVWNHNHKDADNVLGHALLEYRDEGVYAYAKFNDTSQGRNAKELVRNKDITALSIYANKLKHNIKDVIHGNIRELSLVLAGSNPGAYIETVMAHGEGDDRSEEAIITNNAELELLHTGTEKELSEEAKTALAIKEAANLKHAEELKVAKEAADLKHAEEEKQKEVDAKKQKEIDDKKPKKKSEEEKKKMKDKTIKEVFETLDDDQKLMVYALVGAAQEGDNSMKQNLFDKEIDNEDEFLTHAEFETALTEAKRNGSLKEAFIAHSISNINNLFPEVQNLNKQPELISRDVQWVAGVMAGVSKSPFSRVKSTGANLTADEARAKGYVKGAQKVEEVITSLKRVTTPTTVYKLQKLDRDDVIDITDFDVIVFMKSEMRIMLNEELARAFLIGDGRSGASPDKVNPLNIRPIWGDDPVYTVVRELVPAAEDTAAQKAKAFIQDIIRSRKLYKGSGNPALYTTEDQLVEMLLMEDTNGRVIYDSVAKLQTALRVSKIVTVEVMEGVNRVISEDQWDLMGILVNLTDYNVGADKGGQVNMFDDFDLNFNKYEYLIETRCSGALKKPYSAVVFESKGPVVAG